MNWFRSLMGCLGAFTLGTGLGQPPVLAQMPLGTEVLQQIQQCVRTMGTQHPPLSLEQLQLVAMQCTFTAIAMAPDGQIYPNVDDRLTALVQTLGIRLPNPTGTGTARVSLTPLTESRVFTLPVKVGGTVQEFLLDTGASASILSRPLLDRAASLPAHRAQQSGVDLPDRLFSYLVVGEDCQGLGASLHILPPMQVGQAQVANLMGMGFPPQSMPKQLAGVLGMDFLSRFDFSLDPQALTLELRSHTASSRTASPAPTAIPLRGKMGIMTTQVWINGQGPFTFALDTGAGWVVLSPQLAQALKVTAKAQAIAVLGFCGTAPAQWVVLDRVSIQTHTVEQLDTVILTDSRPLELLGVDGVIGQNFLNQFRQTWRFGDRTPLGFPATGTLELTPLTSP
ncbi:retroviral-like aspartic protease family protein [Trichothermofontia sichuanensis B231]|uniref:retropepsin-like aspartic protease n=1 Tax=Trichothermofontia sichuanensis TaxID=3045816 RepID=UPI0022485767|nr:retropepsin-like aspartic protease [Trichothermofontia sichuanensis]UZQ52922.1 retroviral-like aspartic protease family protein [Trichothermofontia sichuanensis B231]